MCGRLVYGISQRSQIMCCHFLIEIWTTIFCDLLRLLHNKMTSIGWHGKLTFNLNTTPNEEMSEAYNESYLCMTGDDRYCTYIRSSI